MTAQETQGDATIQRLCQLGGVSRALDRDPGAVEVLDRAVGLEVVGAPLEPIPSAEHERA